MLESTAPLKFKAHFIDMIETPSTELYLEKKLYRFVTRLAKLHSVAIGEFPRWQTLFHLQKISTFKI